MKNAEYPEGLDKWILHYLKGELSPEEERGLQKWRKEAEGHERLFRKFIHESQWSPELGELARYDAGQAWKAVTGKYKFRKRRAWLRIAGVAAVVVLCAGAAFTLLYGPQEETRLSLRKNRPLAGVRLSRSTGEVFDLEKGRRIESGHALIKSDSQTMVVTPRQTAAGTEMADNTVDVPQGAEYHLILPDGSEVFLNAGTSLRFPESFEGKTRREVYLSGEAYFNVVPDAAHPFIVYTDQTYVRVLGTSFNVMAYPGEPEQQTTLVKGRVVMGEQAGGRQVELLPGMQGAYSLQQGTLENREVDVSYYVAWKEGWFAFRERRFEEVIEILARWYGFEYFFQNSEARDYIYTGKLKRHDNLEEVLKSFRMTEELDFKVKDKTVIIRTNN